MSADGVQACFLSLHRESACSHFLFGSLSLVLYWEYKSAGSFVADIVLPCAVIFL